MKEFKIILAGSIIILGIEGLFFLGPKGKTKVLSEKVEVTAVPTASPIPTDSPSPSPTPTVKPSPRPTKTPTPVPTPTPETSQQINEFIDRYSGQYSVDPNVMRHIAVCESGFNPLAVNGPYVGLYQFGSVTWKNIRLEMKKDANVNLRFSAEESVQTASYAFSKGKKGIWPHCQP